MEKAEFCVLFSPWFRVLCIFRVLIFALLSLLNMSTVLFCGPATDVPGCDLWPIWGKCCWLWVVHCEICIELTRIFCVYAGAQTAKVLLQCHSAPFLLFLLLFSAARGIYRPASCPYHICQELHQTMAGCCHSRTVPVILSAKEQFSRLRFKIHCKTKRATMNSNKNNSGLSEMHLVTCSLKLLPVLIAWTTATKAKMTASERAADRSSA